MPIDETIKNKVLKDLEGLGALLESHIKEIISEEDEEDLELGLHFQLEDPEILEKWHSHISGNVYMEVESIDVMEHHDGVYVKLKFVNKIGRYKAERNISIWSNGKCEKTHGLIINTDGMSVRIDEALKSLKISVKLEDQ